MKNEKICIVCGKRQVVYLENTMETWSYWKCCNCGTIYKMDANMNVVEISPLQDFNLSSNCTLCGKEITTPIYHNGKVFCDLKCYLNYYGYENIYNLMKSKY